MFVKFYDILVHSIITESFGHKCNVTNNVTIANSNLTVTLLF